MSKHIRRGKAFGVNNERNSYMYCFYYKFHLSASYPPAFLIVVVSYVGYDVLSVVILLSLAMGCMGCWYAGVKVNAMDLGPNYAGSLTAILNGFGAISGAIAPYVAGMLTPNVNNIV